MPLLKGHIAQIFDHLSDRLMKPLDETKWFEKNRPTFEKELLQNGRVDPKKIFIIIDAIEYRPEVEHIPTGQKIKVGDFEYKMVEFIPKTGVVKPVVQFGESTFTLEDYERIIDKFDLRSAVTVPVEKFTQIATFKKDLETKFDIQASAIVTLHEQIAEDFGTLYTHAEQAMLDEQRKNKQNDHGNRPPDGWSELTLKLHSIFNRIQYGLSPDKIKELRVLDPLLQNEFINQDFAEKTSERIMRACRKRDPMIEELRGLTKKILPLGSIIEDFNSDQEIKSMRGIREKEILIDMPIPSVYAQNRAGENKNKKGSDVKVLTAALKLLRNKLVDEIVSGNDWKVSHIAAYLVENTEGFRPGQTNSTVTNLINDYYADYLDKRKKRLKNG